MTRRWSIAARTLACLVVAAVVVGAISGVAAGVSGGATTASLSDTDSRTIALTTAAGSTIDGLENTTDETTDDLENTTDETTDGVETVTDGTTDAAENTTGVSTEPIDGTVNATSDTLEATVDETTNATDDTVNGTAGVVDETATDVRSTVNGTVGIGAGTGADSDTQRQGSAATRDSGANETATDGDAAPVDPPTSSEAATNAILVGLLGAITASGGAAGGAGGAGAGGSAGTAAAGWLRHLQSTDSLRTAGSDLWKLLPVFRYSRYDDSDPLEHDRRRAIYEAIRDRPGRYLSAVSDRTEIPLSTVRYHVRILEEEDLVTGRKVNGKRRYFLEDADAELQAALAEPAKRALLETLADLERAPNGRLAEALDRDPSTISHHLAALEDDGLVVRERDGRSIVNELPPRVERALGGPESETASRPAPADD